MELIEAGSPGICKVDFINNVIAIELLTIVENWYECLRKTPEVSLFQTFLSKQGKSWSEVIRYLMPILAMSITYIYADLFYRWFEIENEITILSIQKLIVIYASAFLIGMVLGRKTESFLDRQIDQIEDYPIFLITKVDQNFVNEFEERNQKTARQIWIRLCWLIFSAIISAFGKVLIEHIL